MKYWGLDFLSYYSMGTIFNSTKLKRKVCFSCSFFPVLGLWLVQNYKPWEDDMTMIGHEIKSKLSLNNYWTFIFHLKFLLVCKIQVKSSLKNYIVNNIHVLGLAISSINKFIFQQSNKPFSSKHHQKIQLSCHSHFIRWCPQINWHL